MEERQIIQRTIDRAAEDTQKETPDVVWRTMLLAGHQRNHLKRIRLA